MTDSFYEDDDVGNIYKDRYAVTIDDDFEHGMDHDVIENIEDLHLLEETREEPNLEEEPHHQMQQQQQQEDDEFAANEATTPAIAQEHEQQPQEKYENAKEHDDMFLILSPTAYETVIGLGNEDFEYDDDTVREDDYTCYIRVEAHAEKQTEDEEEQRDMPPRSRRRRVAAAERGISRKIASTKMQQKRKSRPNVSGEQGHSSSHSPEIMATTVPVSNIVFTTELQQHPKKKTSSARTDQQQQSTIKVQGTSTKRASPAATKQRNGNNMKSRTTPSQEVKRPTSIMAFFSSRTPAAKKSSTKRRNKAIPISSSRRNTAAVRRRGRSPQRRRNHLPKDVVVKTTKKRNPTVNKMKKKTETKTIQKPIVHSRHVIALSQYCDDDGHETDSTPIEDVERKFLRRKFQTNE